MFAGTLESAGREKMKNPHVIHKREHFPKSSQPFAYNNHFVLVGISVYFRKKGLLRLPHGQLRRKIGKPPSCCYRFRYLPR
jgi:hypothetical protein